MMHRIHFLMEMTAEVCSFGESRVSIINQSPDSAELQCCLLMTTTESSLELSHSVV